MKRVTPKKKKRAFPIKHWSHSSLMAFLRNPLAWYKRYVENIRDTPSNPAGIIGRAAHVALQHYYLSSMSREAYARAHTLPRRADSKDEVFLGGIGLPAQAGKEMAIGLGLEYLRSVADFEVNFGKAKSRRAQKEKRAHMERDYLQAVSFYLARAPKHKVIGVEVVATAEVKGLALPIKAVSDLVVESRIDPGALDIVDHKFVDVFSKGRGQKTLFIMQALFNYYTVRQMYGKEVRRFIVQECKKRKNADGSSQMRRYIIDYTTLGEEFAVFHRLLNDATKEITRERLYLPNPSDMFEGENSFDIYRLGLLEDNLNDSEL